MNVNSFKINIKGLNMNNYEDEAFNSIWSHLKNLLLIEEKILKSILNI